MIDVKEIKAKVIDFFSKNKLKIFIGTVVVIFILLLNYFLRIYKTNEPITTKEPFAPVMTPNDKFPSKVYIESEALILNFANKASNGDYDAAYEYLSDDCKLDVFSVKEEFIKYVKTNFPKGSRFEVIPYSKVGTTYIYQVKVFEDFLATGLTYSDYSYIDLKIAVNEDVKGEKKLSVAGYMGRFPLNSIFENDYIRIELLERKSFYTEELYFLKVINRTENDIVLQDFLVGAPEIQLSLGGDVRKEIGNTDKIILSAYEEKELKLHFVRFFDEESIPGSIVFSAVRVIKPKKANRYKESDILAKFSIPVEVVY